MVQACYCLKAVDYTSCKIKELCEKLVFPQLLSIADQEERRN